MDRAAAGGLQVADHGPDVAGDGEVAVGGRVRAAEAGQVHGLAVDEPGEPVHQGRPVGRRAAEAVHEETGLPPVRDALRGRPVHREDRPGDLDRTYLLLSAAHGGRW